MNHYIQLLKKYNIDLNMNVYLSFLKAYSKLNDLDEMFRLLQDMKQMKIRPNIQVYIYILTCIDSLISLNTIKDKNIYYKKLSLSLHKNICNKQKKLYLTNEYFELLLNIISFPSIKYSSLYINDLWNIFTILLINVKCIYLICINFIIN